MAQHAAYSQSVLKFLPVSGKLHDSVRIPDSMLARDNREVLTRFHRRAPPPTCCATWSTPWAQLKLVILPSHFGVLLPAESHLFLALTLCVLTLAVAPASQVTEFWELASTICTVPMQSSNHI